MVFDCPSIAGSFEQRLNSIKDNIDSWKTPYIHLVTQEMCKGEKHLKERLDSIEKRNGAGVILRKPGSLYNSKRSVLKAKSYERSQGLVLKHEEVDGRVRTLIVRNTKGQRFKVKFGIPRIPPPVGSTIIYKYKSLSSSGKPKDPMLISEF